MGIVLRPVSIATPETELRKPGTTEKIAEYGMWSLLAQAHLRYLMRGGRLVPYPLAGGGMGFTEFNDRRLPATVNNVTGGLETDYVGTAGMGIEYFIANDIALGVEVKHVFLFSSEVSVNGAAKELQLDPLFVNASLRIFF